MNYTKFCGINDKHGPHEYYGFLGGVEHTLHCKGYGTRKPIFAPPVGNPIVYQQDEYWWVNVPGKYLARFYYPDMALRAAHLKMTGKVA